MKRRKISCFQTHFHQKHPPSPDEDGEKTPRVSFTNTTACLRLSSDVYFERRQQHKHMHQHQIRQKAFVGTFVPDS